jgi:DNA-binding NtrC family response regulator
MSYSVVVIDDDGITLDVMVSMIEDNFDATVYSFTDGKTAKQFLVGHKDTHLDLIITDVIMPRYTGIELLAFIRREGIKAPVLLVSAEVTRENAIEAKKHGASGYMVKPFTKDDLVSKVKPLLS